MLGTGNLVEGNFIGTDITGTQPLGNGSSYGSGISVPGFNLNLLAYSDSLLSAETIGGTTPGAGNLISGNSGNGIYVGGFTEVQVLGNMIGTDVTGTHALGNGTGIYVQEQDNVVPGVELPMSTIGGTAAGAGNLISGNVQQGIAINSGSYTVIQGNVIGTQADEVSPLGNCSDGILVDFTDSNGGEFLLPTNITIGGTAAGAGNTIDDNGGRGVNVVNGGPITILANSIFGNGNLGIDLGGDGVTLNTSGGPHTGPNELQNFPVITQALAGSTTQVVATLNSAPSASFLISFYESPQADPSGYGQGQVYLGSTTVTTDVSGNATVTLDLPVPTSGGEVLTATATDSIGDTSEFSQAVTLVGPTESAGQLGFSVASFTANADQGTATITVDRTSGSAGTVTVGYATSDGSAHAGADYTSASGTLTFAAGVTSQSFTVPILNDAASIDPVTVKLALTDPTGSATLGSQSTATLTIDPTLVLQSINVQKGSVGRSFVRYLDLTFENPTDLPAVINSLNTTSPELKLTYLGLNGTGNANVPLFASEVSITGSKSLEIDFGKGGITGDPTSSTGDGYYQISAASLGGEISTKTFFRLLGDVNGDGVVNNADLATINAAIGESGANLAADVDGSGAVNSLDLEYAEKAKLKGNKLSGTLHLDD